MKGTRNMHFKNEKGYTGIDIAISVVVLFIFVSLIAFLSYGFNSSAKEIELKSQALSLAIDEIETIKSTITMENINTLDTETQEMRTQGFYRTITVEDYADIEPTKTRGLVKKVTVKIQYRFQTKQQTVELSTIVTKES